MTIPESRRVAWFLALGRMPDRFLFMFSVQWLAMCLGVKIEPWQADAACAEARRREALSR